jgi:hypothetical protein
MKENKMENVFFKITADDIQEIAKDRLGRELNEDELDKVGNKINLDWVDEIECIIDVYIGEE